jgi:hypothetical protein
MDIQLPSRAKLSGQARPLAFGACVFLMLTGCGGTQSVFNSHGSAAGRIANLSWFMTILFLVITLIMWMLLASALKRNPGNLNEHAPVDSGGGQAWIAIG